MYIIFLSIPLGLFFFIILTRGITAHLRGLRDKLLFFFWPFPPARMLIVKELDGDYRIYYDNEFEEIAGDDKTIIKTVYGDSYVTDIPFSQASISRSMFSTWGPEGHFTPYSLSWRWAVAASVSVYMTYYSFIMSMFDMSDYSMFMISTIAFMLMLTWLLTNAMRMQDKTIAYAWYHSIGINPPHQKIIPAVALSSLELPDYLSKLGRKIEINVPDDVVPILDKVREKVGSHSLAAVLIAKLSMAQAWRQGLAQALRESFDLRKAGETAAMIRLGQKSGRRMLIVIVAIISFAIGFAFGNIISIGVEPAVQTNNTYAITPAVQPPPPVTPSNETVITPAQPPPPPSSEG